MSVADSIVRVSVIIPAYNAAPYIRETLESVLQQSYPPCEVIVVDDGSTDETVDRAREYGTRVRVVQQQQAGAAIARNLGARIATGDWLAFVDADDTWLAEKLERQVRLIDERSVLIYTDRFNVGAKDGLPAIQSAIQPLYEGDVFESLLLLGNAITTSGVLLRAEVFRRLQGFCEDPRLLPAEDWDLWLRVAAAHQIRACREPLVRYRLHVGGASRSANKMNAARCLVVTRALASSRGRALSWLVRRRIWAQTWRTNGWDAARHGATAKAVAAYVRSIAYWPFCGSVYVELAKAMLPDR